MGVKWTWNNPSSYRASNKYNHHLRRIQGAKAGLVAFILQGGRWVGNRLRFLDHLQWPKSLLST